MIFAPDGPNVLGLPPGADFPAALVAGLLAHHAGQPPETIARTTLFLNTQRMRRRVRACFLQRGATFLPRLRLVTELKDDPLLTGPATSVSALGRRLELAVLIDRLLTAQPDLAPRAALYQLADSLAALMDEMRAEDVSPATLATLDIEGHAAHWARTRSFIALVEGFFGPDAPPDTEARTRAATDALISLWSRAAPPDPVIVAGSTGSRGTTALLMRAVARLPQGAILLPGFDFEMPAAVWPSLGEGIGQEDHPQYRYWKLFGTLGITRSQIRPWPAGGAPAPQRNALISLALRPAPVTDQWIAEGPGLGDLAQATADVTLIEAPDPRSEAQAIALALRQAVERGERAALLSPDRDLTRRVTAALDRWALHPDDSAGAPLVHSAPGRLLRLIARLMGQVPAADQVLTLLKHPLAFSGAARGAHLRLSREYELFLRRGNGPAFPDAESLRLWAEARPEEGAAPWALALGRVLTGLAETRAAPLPDLVARHRALTEDLVRGTGDNADELWAEAAGIEALAAVEELAQEAPSALHLHLSDYSSLFDGILSRRQVRDARTADPRVEILGAQEARILGADLVILAGLTEGVWPAQPAPDPWLNRRMRAEAGLLLPERRIGLSAHDFQMAAAAPRVILSRAARNAEAETVASRWLNRLTNLLAGLKTTGGPQALDQMRARGDALLAQSRLVEAPLPSSPAPRPSPRPPLGLRPRALSLTEVEKLIRDPYAIYARHVLRLNPLPPARPVADARLRGEILHKVPERFLAQPLPDTADQAVAALMQVTDQVLVEDVAWPAMRLVWRARMADLARPFVERLMAEQPRIIAMERKYRIALPGTDFTLIGKPDRIDLTPSGGLRIIDYKTGTPPSPRQQAAFAKQLHLAAVMAWLGAFPEAGLHDRIEIAYVQLKRDLKTVADTLGPEDLERVVEEFRRLIQAYESPARGYTARRAMVETGYPGDYDDLARYGEWDVTAHATALDLPDLPPRQSAQPSARPEDAA